MKASRNQEVVNLFGDFAALEEEIKTARWKISELNEQVRQLQSQLKDNEELLQMVKSTTEIVNGIAIAEYEYRDGLSVHVNAVDEKTSSKWAEAYKQVNSENEWGVKLGQFRTIYNQGLTKERAIKIAKNYVTGKFHTAN